MKFISARLICILCFSVFVSNVNAQNNFFNDVAETAFKTPSQKRLIIPQKYRTIKLDTLGLQSFIRLTPSEKNLSNRDMTPVIAIPMPDGTVARFHIWESSVLAAELAAANPTIKTFTGQGIDDKTATIKLDWTEFGFHAMISSAITGAVFIDPYDINTKTNYISYFKSDFKKNTKYKEIQPIPGKNALKNLLGATPDNVEAAICLGTQLRTYRLAVACTHEYAFQVTGSNTPSKSAVLAYITTTVNRVNGVYEKELSVRLVLVASENNVIFNSLAADPFTPSTPGVDPPDGANYDPAILINESQQVIDLNIGDANYDIGHTFSTGAGGYAALGVVCAFSEKAMGITGLENPTGDPFDIDYVAHEMGHQFGASHTFNSVLGGCDGNGSFTTNVEPGSGSTIMAYAGLCYDFNNPSITDNIKNNSDAYFSTISFDEIGSYITAGAGNSCPVKTSTGNAPPTVNAGSNYIIPVSTPFVLTGSATDANGDALSYCWEQVDGGGPFGRWNAPVGDAPLFRSFFPVSTPTRYFPKLTDQINGTTTIGEILPSYARTMHFRLTARDNKAGGGGVCYTETAVSTVSTGGAFTLTSPSASGIVWNVNEFQTVTWNTAGSNLAPISAANVNIELSTDGGLTFPITILANTPNDGSEEIQVPNNVTTQARIRVKPVGNIFYDFSNTNFSIQVAATASFVFNNPAPVAICSGTSGVATLKSGALKAFATNIALSASLNPAGTTVSFGTASLTPGNSTTVTLNNTGALAPGTYTVRVTGIAGAITKTRDISFLVGSGAAAPASLTAPANDAIGVALQPSLNWTAVIGATSYTVEISTSSTFTTIEQTISGVSSLPVTLSTPLQENTVYYWRVKTTNTCGTGAASAANRFKTGFPSCFPSVDVPKNIDANVASVITSTISIPTAKGTTITDLNIVDVAGEHAYFHELRFTLTSPDNTSVIVLNQLCDGPTFPFDFNLDDQGPQTYECPLTDGVMLRPANPLSVFNGKNSAGTWTLKVEDLVAGEGGQLLGWGLNFNSNSINCGFASSPISTTYTFTGNGNWNVASNWSNNTIPPSPLPSGSTIVINHTAGGQCVLNVAQSVSAGAGVTVLTGKNLVINGALTIQ
jgi:subtilisin-like proprotein convertase family protein